MPDFVIITYDGFNDLEMNQVFEFKFDESKCIRIIEIGEQSSVRDPVEFKRSLIKSLNGVTIEGQFKGYVRKEESLILLDLVKLKRSSILDKILT